jgi:hypothetical protein
MLVTDSFSNNFFYHGVTALVSQVFLIIESVKHTTLGRTPMDYSSARRTDIYLTTHSTHKRQTYMPPTGFEPTIPASKRQQTHALDSAATRIGLSNKYNTKIQVKFNM